MRNQEKQMYSATEDTLLFQPLTDIHLTTENILSAHHVIPQLEYSLKDIQLLKKQMGRL